jgi:hypothetical protein
MPSNVNKFTLQSCVLVAHSGNPSHFGRLRLGRLWFKASLGREFKRPPISIDSWARWYLSSQAIWEAKIRKVTVPDQPGQKKFVRPHLNGRKAGYGGAYLLSQLQQEA